MTDTELEKRALWLRKKEGVMGVVPEKYTLEYFLGVDSLGNKVDYGVEGMEEFLQGTLHSRYKKIIDLVYMERKVVLDLGCGRGDAIRYCLHRGAKKVIGVDFAPAALLIAGIALSSHWTEQYYLVQSEIGAFALKEKVDVVILFDVIEHVPQVELDTFFLRNEPMFSKNLLILWHTPDYISKNPTYSDTHPKTAGMHCNKKSHQEVADWLVKLGFEPTSKFVWRKNVGG